MRLEKHLNTMVISRCVVLDSTSVRRFLIALITMPLTVIIKLQKLKLLETWKQEIINQ